MKLRLLESHGLQCLAHWAAKRRPLQVPCPSVKKSLSCAHSTVYNMTCRGHSPYTQRVSRCIALSSVAAVEVCGVFNWPRLQSDYQSADYQSASSRDQLETPHTQSSSAVTSSYSAVSPLLRYCYSIALTATVAPLWLVLAAVLTIGCICRPGIWCLLRLHTGDPAPLILELRMHTDDSPVNSSATTRHTVISRRDSRRCAGFVFPPCEVCPFFIAANGRPGDNYCSRSWFILPEDFYNHNTLMEVPTYHVLVDFTGLCGLRGGSSVRAIESGTSPVPAKQASTHDDWEWIPLCVKYPNWIQYTG